MRPLTTRMDQYARNDTKYLKPLSDGLRADLQAKGRLAWHQESCARLIADCALTRELDEDLVWRVKGSRLLSRLGLAVLREIWRWREREAIGANRPPFFVLSHDAMVDIAAMASEGRDFSALLPRQLSDRRRAGILAAIEAGKTTRPEHLPRFQKSTSRRVTELEKKRYVELERARDAHAGELGIDPTVIASRSVLSDLAHDWDRHAPELMEWQRHLLTSRPGLSAPVHTRSPSGILSPGSLE
jgi:ribonuclease D